MSDTISTAGLNAITWSLTGLTTVVVAGRLCIRYHIRKGFYWDDFFQVLALVSLFIWSGGASGIYEPADILFEYQRGNIPRPDDFDSLFIYFRKIQTLATIGFWSCLFSVKFSFLCFFRLLFFTSTKFRRAWWAVFIFTAVCFWVPIAGELTKCGPVSEIFSPVACSSPHILFYQKQLEEYGCGVQIGTDLIIMILPLPTLLKLQMRWSQKLGLVGIFCVAFVTIALDVLRMYESIGAGGVFSYSALYCTLELVFATMLASAPTYRSLLGVRRRIRGDIYDDVGMETKDPTRIQLRAVGQGSTKDIGSVAGSARHSDTIDETDLFNEHDDDENLPTARHVLEVQETAINKTSRAGQGVKVDL